MMPAIPRPPRERAINLPGLLLGFVLLLVAIQAARLLLEPESDLRVLLELAFIPAPWSLAFGLAGPDDVVRVAQGEAGDPEAAELRVALARYVVAEGGMRPWTWLSYALLHGSWTHVGLNALWLAAFGSPVVRRAGAARAIVLALVTAFAGALAQWASGPLAVQPMIGASAIVSGFMAAAATFIFSRGRAGRGRWGFLAERNVLVFLGVWLAANLLFGVAAGPLGIADGAIAWQAHIGGLLAGLALFPLIDPPVDPSVHPPRDPGAVTRA